MKTNSGLNLFLGIFSLKNVHVLSKDQPKRDMLYLSIKYLWHSLKGATLICHILCQENHRLITESKDSLDWEGP